MIDWFDVFSSSLWILGLAVMLAVFSFVDYPRNGTARPFRLSLQEAAGKWWAHVGALLFATGMGLTANSLLERLLWAALALTALYSCRFPAKGAAHQPGTPAGDATPSVTDAPREKSAHGLTSWLLIGVEWLVKGEVLWLALLAPFLMAPSPNRLAALLGIPAIWIARRVARRHFVPRTPLDWPLAFMMLMLLVSIFVTPDLAFSLDKITNLILGVAVYYALVAWVSTPGRVRWALLVYSLGGTAVAVVGLLGTGWANKLPLLSNIAAHIPAALKGLSKAPEGFNPNLTAGSLLWIVPVQLALVWHSWSREFMPFLPSGWRLLLRLALAASVGVSAGTLLLAQSRGALLGFGLGGLLLLWLSSRSMRIAVIGVVVAGVGLAAYIGPQQAMDKLLDAPGVQSAVSSGIASGGSRIEIWSRALYGIQDFPFTGMGMHAFRKIQPILYPLFSVAPDADIGHAHNQFLQAALDLGIPGLAAYLAIWLLAGALVVQCWREATEGWRRAAVAGIGAALLAYLVFGMTDVVVLGDKRGFIFWALLALLSALWKDQTNLKLGPANRDEPAEDDVSYAGAESDAKSAGSFAAEPLPE